MKLCSILGFLLAVAVSPVISVVLPVPNVEDTTAINLTHPVYHHHGLSSFQTSQLKDIDDHSTNLTLARSVYAATTPTKPSGPNKPLIIDTTIGNDAENTGFKGKPSTGLVLILALAATLTMAGGVGALVSTGDIPGYEGYEPTPEYSPPVPVVSITFVDPPPTTNVPETSQVPTPTGIPVSGAGQTSHNSGLALLFALGGLIWY